MRYVNWIVLCVLFWFIPITAFAGSLNSLAAPTDPASAMFTVEDIYNRLDAGTAGSKRAGAFTEPSSGPTAGTGHTLDEVMGKAPSVDDTNGAGVADVLASKTFWGLTTGAWGSKTGTMTNRGAGSTITPGTTDQTIDAGYWSSANTVSGDADLVPGNIQIGVTLFGVTGKCHRLPSTGQTAVYSFGDDGSYQLGCLPLVGPCSGADGCNFNRTYLPWSSSSGTGFTDNGNGTVTDNLTGLIWLRNANCFGTRSWANALSDSNGLANESCGLTDSSSAGDWRLPNINELRSLIDPDQNNPALPAGHPFTGVVSSYYWSSSTYAGSSTYAWYVIMTNGRVGNNPKSHPDIFVWPVRSGN